MVEKLHLPFPLLSDPDGEQAIKPYGVWHEGKPFARPAVILVDTRGEESVRQVGEDFADRLAEEDLVEKIRAFGPAPASQDTPSPGTPKPGENAFPVSAMSPYFLGSQFAVTALSGRVPEARDDARRMNAEYDRFLTSVKWLKERRREDGNA